MTTIDGPTVRQRAALALIALFAATTAPADERFAVGGRLDIMVGNGEPANDVPSYGIFATYAASDAWKFGILLQHSDWDFEGPAAILGIQQSPTVETIDSKASQEALSAWAESPFGHPGGWTAFWQLGAGAASIDVPNASGPTASGGQFNIQIDAATTPFVFGVVGLRRELGPHWRLDGALRLEYLFADYTLRDTVSGQTASIGSYTQYGAFFAFAYAF